MPKEQKMKFGFDEKNEKMDFIPQDEKLRDAVYEFMDAGIENGFYHPKGKAVYAMRFRGALSQEWIKKWARDKVEIEGPDLIIVHTPKGNIGAHEGDYIVADEDNNFDVYDTIQFGKKYIKE